MGKKEDLLFEACEDGDLDQVKELTKKSLFSKGADVNAKNKDGDTPLLLAAVARRMKSNKVLMDSGSIPRIKMDFAGVASHLIDFGADINAESRYGGTALCQAASSSNREVVKVLLEAGADLKITSCTGAAPLFYAVHREDREIIQMLLDKGADVNAADQKGKTPLLAAAENGNWDAVKKLVKLGADINVMGPYSNDPGIFALAIRDGEKSIVKLLIEKKADVNRTDWCGYTPLMYACQEEDDDDEIVTMLIEGGADANGKGKGEMTPLMVASSLGREKAVKILLENGAAPETVNSRGNTALIEAIVEPNLKTKVVDILIASGASVNAVNNEKKTALTIASERGFAEIAGILAAHGAEGKILRPEFSGFSDKCIAELDKILSVLNRSLDVKVFIKTLTEKIGFKFDEENMIGAFFKSADSVIILKANSSYRITACSYAQKDGKEGGNIPLVETAGGGLGRVLYAGVFEYKGSITGIIPLLLYEASEILLYAKEHAANYKNRYLYDKALFEKTLSPMKASYYLKSRSEGNEYQYLVVHTGGYSAMAAVKFGSEYGHRVFSECFPSLDPVKNWDAINGKQVTGNYAPEGYEISDYTLFDSLMAQIIDGGYELEQVLRA